MKKEIMEEWVQALRYGNYKQGRDLLCDKNDNYCCLGVLCDIAERKGIVESHKPAGNYPTQFGENRNDGLLPKEVMEWSGISNEDGLFTTKFKVTSSAGIPTETNAIVVMNDSGQYDFNQLADIIEKHYLEL